MVCIARIVQSFLWVNLSIDFFQVCKQSLLDSLVAVEQYLKKNRWGCFCFTVAEVALQTRKLLIPKSPLPRIYGMVSSIHFSFMWSQAHLSQTETKRERKSIHYAKPREPRNSENQGPYFRQQPYFQGTKIISLLEDQMERGLHYEVIWKQIQKQHFI